MLELYVVLGWGSNNKQVVASLPRAMAREDGLWRPRMGRPMSAPLLGRSQSTSSLIQVPSPQHSARSTRSLLRKGGFSQFAEAKTLHPLAKSGPKSHG